MEFGFKVVGVAAEGGEVSDATHQCSDALFINSTSHPSLFVGQYTTRSPAAERPRDALCHLEIFIDHFSGPGRSISEECLCVCQDKNV